MTADAVAAALAVELANEGFPRVPARILLRLMVEPTGTSTAAALSEALELSPAAVSGGIRYLGVLGFVRTTTEPGSRRHVYALPAVPWYSSTLVQDRYSPLVAVIEAGLPEVPAGPARDRLVDMADFFRFLSAEMPMLWERWQRSRG